MSVAQLKQGLAERGLATSGKKAELAARLLGQVGVQQVPADNQPPPAAAGSKQPKYTWVDIKDHVFTPRVPYAGSELPKLHATFDHLTTESRPHEWFKVLDAPEEEYHERAANSEKYRSYRFGHDLDGKDKKAYDGATPITYADMRTLDAFHLLSGLDPAVSREKLFASNRLAIVGHRGADLFNQHRYKMVRKFLHPSDPFKAIKKGQPGHDNLHQVAPVLKSLSKTVRKKVLRDPGKKKALDEQTNGFQGAHRTLKQKCARYKAAGDGLQNDAVCVIKGMLTAFAYRGHTLTPKVSIKGKPHIKLSEQTQRTLWVMFLANIQPGSELGLDNLYNSVDFSYMAEVGETVVFDIPAGWTADTDFTGDESAKVVEWEMKAVHIIGTLRGNRGSEKKYQFAEKMSKAEEDALREKPLIPDRVRIRVTDDAGQVITVAIFDKKGFQMIDTVHTEIIEETKPRVVFDKVAGKPTTVPVPITNSQNTYNHGMGFVDLDDLLAWFYK